MHACIFSLIYCSVCYTFIMFPKVCLLHIGGLFLGIEKLSLLILVILLPFVTKCLVLFSGASIQGLENVLRAKVGLQAAMNVLLVYFSY